MFLDDERFPPADGQDWVIVRSVADAISWVENNRIPDFISFDNDLGQDMPEGRHFAVWLLELDLDTGSIPEHSAYYVHSQNVDAALRIRSRIDAHLTERAVERAAGRPWPPNRPANPWIITSGSDA